MNEIYLLQRLGNIGFCFNVGFWICVFIAVGGAILFFTEGLDYFDLKKVKCYLKKFAMVFAFFTIGAIMIPTQHDLIAIYGLGGVIDYIKSNDRAKQLPDKCIDALNKYIESLNNEKDK